MFTIMGPDKNGDHFLAAVALSPEALSSRRRGTVFVGPATELE